MPGWEQVGLQIAHCGCGCARRAAGSTPYRRTTRGRSTATYLAGAGIAGHAALAFADADARARQAPHEQGRCLPSSAHTSPGSTRFSPGRWKWTLNPRSFSTSMSRSASRIERLRASSQRCSSARLSDCAASVFSRHPSSSNATCRLDRQAASRPGLVEEPLAQDDVAVRTASRHRDCRSTAGEASARSFRPSAPTTLRTVSKFGTRSPDSAL